MGDRAIKRMREAMEELMVDEGLGDLGLLLRIKEIWSGLVGEEAAEKTKPYRLEAGNLYVGAGSHALAQNLHFRVEEIISGIRAGLGIEIKGVIIKIINLR